MYIAPGHPAPEFAPPDFASGAGTSPPDLPREIAFLEAAGFPCVELAAAAAEARRTGVSPDAALLARGAVHADDFYYLVSRALNAPLLSAYWPLEAGLDVELALAGGVARLAPNPAGLGYVVAPRGAALGALLALGPADRDGPPEFAVTTPDHLARLALVTRRGQLAEGAAEGLARGRPELSAKGGMSRCQIICAVSFCSACAAGAGLAPRIALACAFTFLSFVFMSAFILRVEALLAAKNDAPPAAAELSDAALPVYTIVAPLYREAAVLGQLIGALERLDYPRAKLDIKLVVEADDSVTIEALAALSPGPQFQVLVAPPGFPRTKPRALNLALPFARGEMLVVYDAEDEPDAGQLRAAAACFAAAGPELACLQAHLIIDNCDDTWLTRLFALEYAALFDVINPGFANLRLPFPLGGTSNHFRTAALRALSGWDAWNVTEDADLGIRLGRRGLVAATLRSTTHEEAPAELGAWLAQRCRWFKGWLQTLITHSRHPVRFFTDLGLARGAAVAVLLISTLLGALLGPLLFALTLHQAVFGRLFHPDSVLGFIVAGFALTLCLGGAANVIWPAVLGMRARGLAHLAPWMALLPVYYLLMSIAAWAALIDLWRRPFAWAKTEHGLAKSSLRKKRRA